MRRVSWPDEPGYWWAIDLRFVPGPYYYKSHRPHLFIQRPDGEITGMDGWLEKWDVTRKHRFEGPISEPGPPMEFKIDGRIIYRIRRTKGLRLWIDTADIIPDNADGVSFSILFKEKTEEIL